MDSISPQGTLGSAVMNTSDALIVCFSVAKRDSLEACEAKWVPDILMLKKKNKPQAPIVPLRLAACGRASPTDRAEEHIPEDMTDCMFLV